MERQTSSSPVETTDAVAETLERLEVADTLEQLRHHIDDLIERLSLEQQGHGESVRAANGVAPELESQIEHLGEKVESASDLLTELTDLLEAQTERIETIEQQLGEPDLSGYAARVPLSRADAGARGGVPTFAMRPPAPPAPLAIGAPDPSDVLREYVDARLERLEDSIRALETRIAEIGEQASERDRRIGEMHRAAAQRDLRIAQLSEAAAERDRRIAELTEAAAAHDQRIATMNEAAVERDRQVRELEESLLVVVEASIERETAEPMPPPPQGYSAPHGAHNAYAPRSFAANAPRPAAMPLFAHRSAPIERPVVRAQSKASHATREARQMRVEHGARSSRDDEEGGGGADRALSSVSLAGPDTEPPPSLLARSEPVALAAADAAPNVSDPRSEGDAAPEPPRNGVAARLLGRESPGLRMHAASCETPPRSQRAAPAAVRADASRDVVRHAEGGQTEEVISRPVRALEQLVERDVWLRRNVHPSNGARPAKARPIVLVADDSPDALTVLSIFLSKTGYQVVTATSAEDCLAKLRHHQIDVVVLDARMPGADGGHVCRVLREDPAYAARRDVPVIVYTGYPDDFPVGVCEEWRADDYVVKGGDMLPLITALVRHTTAADA